MTGRGLPPSYERLTHEGVHAFAWAPAVEWMTVVLREEGTLDAWAGRHAEDERLGRGPVRVVGAQVAGPDGTGSWAVRHYRRGGMAAPLLRDRYWGPGPTRPERELVASAYARDRGVRTPAVVAGAAYRSGSSGRAGFYRADLVTELVPDARALAELARDGSDMGRALRVAGGLARALGAAGLMHADLSAGNVLIDGAGDAWVVDLDRARPSRRHGPRAARVMLARLERSLRKLRAAHGAPLSVEELRALRAGFEDGA